MKILVTAFAACMLVACIWSFEVSAALLCTAILVTAIPMQWYPKEQPVQPPAADGALPLPRNTRRTLRKKRKAAAPAVVAADEACQEEQMPDTSKKPEETRAEFGQQPGQPAAAGPGVVQDASAATEPEHATEHTAGGWSPFSGADVRFAPTTVAAKQEGAEDVTDSSSAAAETGSDGADEGSGNAASVESVVPAEDVASAQDVEEGPLAPQTTSAAHDADDAASMQDADKAAEADDSTPEAEAVQEAIDEECAAAADEPSNDENNDCDNCSSDGEDHNGLYEGDGADVGSIDVDGRSSPAKSHTAEHVADVIRCDSADADIGRDQDTDRMNAAGNVLGDEIGGFASGIGRWGDFVELAAEEEMELPHCSSKLVAGGQGDMDSLSAEAHAWCRERVVAAHAEGSSAADVIGAASWLETAAHDEPSAAPLEALHSAVSETLTHRSSVVTAASSEVAEELPSARSLGATPSPSHAGHRAKQPQHQPGFRAIRAHLSPRTRGGVGARGQKVLPSRGVRAPYEEEVLKQQQQQQQQARAQMQLQQMQQIQQMQQMQQMQQQQWLAAQGCMQTTPVGYAPVQVGSMLCYMPVSVASPTMMIAYQ